MLGWWQGVLVIPGKKSQFASYSALLRLLHKHEKYLCNPSSHNKKYGEYAHETSAHPKD